MYIIHIQKRTVNIYNETDKMTKILKDQFSIESYGCPIFNAYCKQTSLQLRIWRYIVDETINTTRTRLLTGSL